MTSSSIAPAADAAVNDPADPVSSFASPSTAGLGLLERAARKLSTSFLVELALHRLFPDQRTLDIILLEQPPHSRAEPRSVRGSHFAAALVACSDRTVEASGASASRAQRMPARSLVSMLSSN